VTEHPAAPGISTPAAAAAVAQTRDSVTELAPSAPAAPSLGTPDFIIGPGVRRSVLGRPYDRQPDDPVYRPLWIYALDPGASRAEGATARVNVPYEPLKPGPVGAVFRVDPTDPDRAERYVTLAPEDPRVLIRNGRPPSPADPRFHQQMVYAVCSLVYAAFRSALGRHVAWGFDRVDVDPDGRERTRLLLRPHAGLHSNAWYDAAKGALCFGYHRAPDKVAGRNVPGGFVFTCLSHDVVAHEVVHALIDGLRAHFTVPSGADVLGFHEGFADLIAILQHFSYPEVVRAAIARSRGSIGQAEVLVSLARQFGHTTGSDRALRTAVDVDARGMIVPRRYDPDLEQHRMGSVLVSAVFDAFLEIFRRKTERYVRLATGGTGRLPPGELPADLQAVLAEEASQLASQFQTICIRAVDYCPPVDLELGEFLRAVITADYDLVPDDPWGYREAWIEAFARHGVYPPQVRSLAEDELRWKPPDPVIDPVSELTFAELEFGGDPAVPADAKELDRQAHAVGQMVTMHLASFGLARPGDPELEGDHVDAPCVQSVRTSRRVGPDGQVVFDLVAEVTQRRIATRPDGSRFVTYGGATVLIGPQGEVRYVIAKNILNARRLKRQGEFIGGRGARYWVTDPTGIREPGTSMFRLLHDGTG
jgi:hypothetical protein